MNFLPIAERELRVAARRPGTYWLRLGCALFFAAVWFTGMATGLHRGSLYVVNRSIFQWMTAFAFIIGSLAGLALTADCLSREKREGTLGLLFLTDLHGFDIVLGKLSAKAIHVLYALLAITPILALPLLVGGVGGREVMAVAVALLDGLLLFMAIGLIVSAFAQDGRLAFAGAFVLALGITVGLPGLYGIGWRFGSPLAEEGVVGMLCLWPSPAYLLIKALFSPGSALFGKSAGSIACLATVLLMVTCRVLPHRWEVSEDTSKGCGFWARRRQRERYGVGTWRERWRQANLARDPAFWLATRDRPLTSLLCSAFGLLLPIWLLFWLMLVLYFAAHQYFILCFMTTFVLHILTKVAIATEVASRLCADRQSGAGELLVVTPLTRWEVIEGQHQGARFLYAKPLLVLASMNLLLYWLVNKHASELHISEVEQGVFSTLFIGGAIALATDFRALSWTGMRVAWPGGNHLRATTLALAAVMGPSWLALFSFFFICAFHGPSQEAVEAFFSVWTVSGICWSLLVASRSRWVLKRACASRAAKPWP